MGNVWWFGMVVGEILLGLKYVIFGYGRSYDV